MPTHLKILSDLLKASRCVSTENLDCSSPADTSICLGVDTLGSGITKFLIIFMCFTFDVKHLQRGSLADQTTNVQISWEDHQCSELIL